VQAANVQKNAAIRERDAAIETLVKVNETFGSTRLSWFAERVRMNIDYWHLRARECASVEGEEAEGKEALVPWIGDF
jgi:hypothetical protein